MSKIHNFTDYFSKKYPSIKKFIESKGCKLLSTEYAGNHSLLEIQCKCGNITNKSYHKFKDRESYFCKVCSVSIRSRKRSNSIDKVRDYVNSTGCQLLSEYYVNSSSVLEIKCVCGNIFNRKYSIFKSSLSKKCDGCGYTNQKTGRLLTFENVKSFIESKGSTLLSNNYTGLMNPLHIRCTCGKDHYTSMYHFKHQNSKCKVCIKKEVRDKNLLPYAKVKKDIESTGCKLISKEYLGATSPLIIQCVKCGSEFERLYGTFMNGSKPCCIKCAFKDTNQEVEIRNFLNSELGIKNIEVKNRSILGQKEVDIFLPDYNLGIECNGLFWHVEGKGKNSEYHLDKTDRCNEKGIDLIHIHDREWMEKTNVFKSLIMDRLGMSTTIPVVDCSIRLVSKELEESFIENNHFQGYVPSQVALGLYYKNDLVCAMSFKSYRGGYELLRLCTKLDHVVVGGPNKLFKHFIDNYSPESIIIYSDRSKFSGKVYTNLGFEFSHNSRPGYFYYKGNQLFSKVKFQKHKLSKLLSIYDPNLSEWDNMKNNRYDRYWDCGNAVYIWTRPTKSKTSKQ